MATTSSPVEVLLSVAARNVLSNARLHTPFASSVTHDCAVSADNIAAAASAGRAFAGPSSLPSTAHHRAPAHHWTPGELETLMTIVESADPTMRLPVHRGLEALGWASLPDPNRSVYTRVKSELRVLRCRVQHGEEPVAAERATRRKNMAMTWAAWIRAAVAQMGNKEFTAWDVAARLEADPHISPLLDRRQDPNRKARLRWHRQLDATLARVPGVVKVGRRRGRRNLLRYSPTTAVPAKRRRQPTKGVPGLPHLGRHEGSKGDAAAAGQQQQQ